MEGNDIHPTAILEGDVRLGVANQIGPYCVLRGPLVLGDRNRIGPYVAIGGRADEIWQREHDDHTKRIDIGSDCVLREHVTVHKPCYGEVTAIGDRVYLMHGAYVAHDARLADGAILAQNTAIGGVSQVLEGGYVAMGAILHQLTLLGHYGIVGAAAAAVRNVRPFTRFIPGQPVTVNDYAITRYGFEEARDDIERYVRERRWSGGERVGAMIDEYERLHTDSGRGQY